LSQAAALAERISREWAPSGHLYQPLAALRCNR
jgi:hypothetical protein